MSNKEMVIAALSELPEDATLDEIVEHIRIMAAIRQGQKDVKAGRFISHEEMKKRMSEWTSR